jgi:hypothetical protein
MRIIITESQYKMLMEEQKVLHIPSMKIFDDDWNLLQKFLERKGNPPYTIGGDLNLRGIEIESLGNLRSVGGFLNLFGAKIESLGNLQSVGGNLNLTYSEIKSLGNLQSVGGGLYLRGNPLSKKYSRKEIIQMVQVGNDIYF